MTMKITYFAICLSLLLIASGLSFASENPGNQSVLSQFAQKPAAPVQTKKHSSYYLQQYKSCQHKKMPRENWRDFLMATHPVITDQCCWNSVEAMESVGAKRIKDDECHAGTARTKLNCPTSKSWCVKR